MYSGKVLLVDDETDFTTVLSERLNSRGFYVDSAENGNDAVKKIDKMNYDVIFLDLAMPGIDGIETLKQILFKNPNLQVYLLTGRATVQNGVEAMKLGAKDVIEKPVDIKAMLEKIKEAQTRNLVIMQESIETKIHDLLQEKGW